MELSLVQMTSKGPIRWIGLALFLDNRGASHRRIIKLPRDFHIVIDRNLSIEEAIELARRSA